MGKLEFLKKKELGLPLYAWAAILAVVMFLAYRHFRSKSSAANSAVGVAPANAASDAAQNYPQSSGDSGGGSGSGLQSPDFLPNTAPLYQADSTSDGGYNVPYGVVPAVIYPPTSPAETPPSADAKATPQATARTLAPVDKKNLSASASMISNLFSDPVKVGPKVTAGKSSVGKLESQSSKNTVVLSGAPKSVKTQPVLVKANTGSDVNKFAKKVK